MQENTAVLPTSWDRVAQCQVKRYSDVRCERWQEDLIYIDNGMPKPMHFEDRVQQGFARKAAKMISHTCADCGQPAKARSSGDSWSVHCAACHGKRSLVLQISELLTASEEDSMGPFDRGPGLWPEHELPLLLRSCIPGACWRNTRMPNGDILRYLLCEDLKKLVPWFKRLEGVMRPTVQLPTDF